MSNILIVKRWIVNNLSNDRTVLGGAAVGQGAEPVTARELIALLFDTSRLLCLRSDRLLGAAVGLSEARARLLVAVSESEPARMGRLAADLGVSARSVTSMVDALEGQGLLVREPDPEDRRATLLRLTQDSRQRMSRLHTAQHDLAEDLLAALDPHERATLARTLAVLRDGADTIGDDARVGGGNRR